MLAGLPGISCAAPPKPRPEIVARPIEGVTLPDQPGEARLDAAYVLTSRDREFGGISSAAMAGGRLLLLSDRSRLFVLNPPPVQDTARGFALGIVDKRRLTTAQGDELDAEAMIVTDDAGGLVVSDEGSGRLEVFRPGQMRALRSNQPAPRLAALGARNNEGVEALARLPDGSLLVMAEGRTADALFVMAARSTEKDWLPLRYRPGDGFSPTELAVAGDYLFVLERRISLLTGWQARLVAVSLAHVPARPGEMIQGRELAVISGASLGENYEALVATQTAPCDYRFVLLSDDNFNALQQTLWLELSWTAAASSGCSAARDSARR